MDGEICRREGQAEILRELDSRMREGSGSMMKFADRCTTQIGTSAITKKPTINLYRIVSSGIEDEQSDCGGFWGALRPAKVPRCKNQPETGYPIE